MNPEIFPKIEFRRYTFQTIIFGVCRNSFNPPEKHEQNGAKQLHPNMINFRFHVTLGEWSVSWVVFLNKFCTLKVFPFRAT